jgi:hypothetical protein
MAAFLMTSYLGNAFIRYRLPSAWIRVSCFWHVERSTLRTGSAGWATLIIQRQNASEPSLRPPADARRTELRTRHSGRLTALFAVALMIPAVRGEACSCPGPDPPPSEARRLATAVFEGTIVDQRAVLINVYDMTYPAIDYEVTLTRVWKGTPGRTVHVLRRGPCDPAFRVGNAYLSMRTAISGAGCWRRPARRRRSLPTTRPQTSRIWTVLSRCSSEPPSEFQYRCRPIRS